MTLNGNTVERILAKVGDFPASLDKAALIRDLERADLRADIYDSASAQPTDEMRKNRLANIEKYASLLIEELIDQSGLLTKSAWDDPNELESSVYLALERHRLEKGLNFDAVSIEIGILADAARAARRALERGEFHIGDSWPDDETIPKGTEHLVTEWLPEAYKRHFDERFGSSVSETTGPGPGIRFISACLEELQRPLGPEAIKKRLARAKSKPGTTIKK